MGKIRKDCERRHLRGCSGCTNLHSCSAELKPKPIKKFYNYEISMKLAKEEEKQFFKEFKYEC
jgi:hypothetical protein